MMDKKAYILMLCYVYLSLFVGDPLGVGTYSRTEQNSDGKMSVTQ